MHLKTKSNQIDLSNMKQILQLITDDDLDYGNQYGKIFIHQFFKKFKNNKEGNFINYHWNKYDKLKKDYEYLEIFQKKLLDDISSFLNKFHKVNYSNLYWEILIGDWLHSFCFRIFDRYEILNSLDYDKFKYVSKFKKFSDKDMIVQSTEEQANIFWLKDYDSYLFFKIINTVPAFKKNFLISIENIKPNELLSVKEKFNRRKANLKITWFNIYKTLFAKILQNQKYPLLRSYLGFKDDILINFKLRQLPSFIPNNYFNCEVNYDLRKELIIEDKSTNDYEKFIYNNIFLFIPVSYIEGFFIEEKKLSKLNLPLNPKKIFSANVHGKSLLTRYCANKKEKGSKLILAVHGGSYGHYDIHFSEKFEKKISDLYFTWGWKDERNPKVKPFGIIRPLPKIKKKDKPHFLTMIVPAKNCFANNFESPISLIHKNDFHFNPFFKIIDNIDKEIQSKNLLIRFYNRNFGLNEFEIFNTKYPTIQKDIQQLDYKDLISNTKIFLSPYLGTGYLETLALNVPTIIFTSKKNNYVIRDDVKNYYQNLKKTKIFFDDEIELSNHINTIWKDPRLWWNSKKVQDEVKIFTNEFAYINKDKLENLKNILINSND